MYFSVETGLIIATVEKQRALALSIISIFTRNRTEKTSLLISRLMDYRITGIVWKWSLN